MKVKKINKLVALFAVVCLLGSFRYASTQAPANNENVEPCFIENQTFLPGEKLTYKLYYNWGVIWLPAGEANFEVKQENGQYHFSAVGKTYSSYEWFFKVRDYYDTYVDENTLLPTVSIRDVHEGGYKLYDKVEFDQENGIATSHRGDYAHDARPTAYGVSSCMHDILSILYFTRNVNFTEMSTGSTFPISIFMDKEEWPLSVKYNGAVDNKKIKGLGKFNTLKFSPGVIAGTVFKEDTQMDVYVSNDNNRIPLLIESPVSVGSVKAVLKNYSGLKYDLTARLK